MSNTKELWRSRKRDEAVEKLRSFLRITRDEIYKICDELTENYMDHGFVEDLEGDKTLLIYTNPDPPFQILYKVDHLNKAIDFLQFFEERMRVGESK